VPAYCPALGKVLLKYLEEKKLNDYLAEVKLEPLT